MTDQPGSAKVSVEYTIVHCDKEQAVFMADPINTAAKEGYVFTSLLCVSPMLVLMERERRVHK